MEKYIYNTIELEIDTEESRHDEESKVNQISDEGTARNQMRGFELIMKVFQHISLVDWLMV
jgi:hypothetical protein